MRRNEDVQKKDYVLICALIVGALLIISNDDYAPRLWHAYQSLGWQSTEGYVMESKPHERCGTKDRCFPEIIYSYAAGGRSFIGTNITPVTQESYLSNVSKGKARKYIAGTNVKVFYDPNDPQSSCLEPGFDTVFIGTYLILLFGVAIGALGIVLLIRSLYHSLKPSDASRGRALWKETRRDVLDHHLLTGEVIRAATVRVTPNESGWRTVFEWRRPNPTFLQVDLDGITFVRGEEPQDDSVLRGKPTVRIPWADIESIKFNKWYRSAVKINLMSGHYGFESIFVRWLADSGLKPYDIHKTESVYHLLEQYYARSVNNHIVA